MKDAIATVGTSLEVLAPYLPYGIEVQIGRMPEVRMPLIGLIMHKAAEPAILLDKLTGRPVNWKVSGITPCLRPFSQLVTSLEDGTVPAVEVAKLIGKMKAGDKLSKMEYWEHHPTPDAEAVAIQCVGGWTFFLTKGGPGAGTVPLCVADYLRKHHFAVGLEPHQFIEKQGSATTQEGGSRA